MQNLQNPKSKTQQDYFKIKKELENQLENKDIKNKRNPKQNFVDKLYLKNTENINEFFENNKRNINLIGTKEINEVPSSQALETIKTNQKNWTERIPGLKYVNPEKNKYNEELTLTPLPEKKLGKLWENEQQKEQIIDNEEFKENQKKIIQFQKEQIIEQQKIIEEFKKQQLYLEQQQNKLKIEEENLKKQILIAQKEEQERKEKKLKLQQKQEEEKKARELKIKNNKNKCLTERTNSKEKKTNDLGVYFDNLNQMRPKILKHGNIKNIYYSSKTSPRNGTKSVNKIIHLNNLSKKNITTNNSQLSNLKFENKIDLNNLKKSSLSRKIKKLCD